MPVKESLESGNQLPANLQKRALLSGTEFLDASTSCLMRLVWNLCAEGECPRHMMCWNPSLLFVIRLVNFVSKTGPPEPIQHV